MKIISSTLKSKKLIPKSSLSLKELYEKRNKVLIIRDRRGLGDILMCRMIFEDFHRVMPDIQIVFACPSEYHSYIKDHPFIHSVIDSKNVKRSDYLISYDISNCCIYYECKTAFKADKHRADIWAEHCGVILTKHNMFLPFIPSDLINSTKNKLDLLSSKPKILFCPFAYDKLRTLNEAQIIGTVDYLKSKDFFVYTTHTEDSEFLEDLGVKVFANLEEFEWLSYIHAADYVVTVDTSVFHYAGGIKKPMVGIFTHVDGNYRGKYFDFVLVQKDKNNGGWKDCACFDYSRCTHPNCTDKSYYVPKPCLTELSIQEIKEGIDKMLLKYK